MSVSHKIPILSQDVASWKHFLLASDDAGECCEYELSVFTKKSRDGHLLLRLRYHRSLNPIPDMAYKKSSLIFRLPPSGMKPSTLSSRFKLNTMCLLISIHIR